MKLILQNPKIKHQKFPLHLYNFFTTEGETFFKRIMKCLDIKKYGGLTIVFYLTSFMLPTS